MAYRKLYKEYKGRVVFIPVRTDFQHETKKSYAQRCSEAAEWGRKTLPGDIYLVDPDSYDFLRFGTVKVPSWARPEKPGGIPKGWGYMYILNRKGKIVYQHFSSPAFQYARAKKVLDALLETGK